MKIVPTLLTYLKGIVVHPDRTFKVIKQDKNVKAYTWLLVPVVLVSNVVFSLLVPLKGLSREQHILIGLFTIPFSLGFVYIIARIFKKKGSLLTLFVASSLVGVVSTPISLLYELGKGNFIAEVFYPVFLLWILYVQALAISVIYGFSKKKSVFIIVLPIVLFIIIAISISFANMH